MGTEAVKKSRKPTAPNQKKKKLVGAWIGDLLKEAVDGVAKDEFGSNMSLAVTTFVIEGLEKRHKLPPGVKHPETRLVITR